MLLYCLWKCFFRTVKALFCMAIRKLIPVLISEVNSKNQKNNYFGINVFVRNHLHISVKPNCFLRFRVKYYVWNSYKNCFLRYLGCLILFLNTTHIANIHHFRRLIFTLSIYIDFRNWCAMLVLKRRICLWGTSK